jgi:tRNA G18 (ribose-2'-O)-methylase SpoU
MKKNLVIIAHNIRSAYNIGAIFRTADGMGASSVFLTGYSPSPDKGQFQTSAGKMIAKIALGSEKSLTWEKKSRLGPLLKKLKTEKFQIVALEQNERSADYRKLKPQFPVALILGNEPKGIDQKILKTCDRIVEIPMRGEKNSLNVAVALGVAGYEIMR